MPTLLITIHVIAAVGIVIVILLQSGKGGGLAGTFGGTGSAVGTVFGGRGAAEFLIKITVVLGVVFAITCFSLNFISPIKKTEIKSAFVDKMRKQAKNSPAAALPTAPVSQSPITGNAPTGQPTAPGAEQK